MRVLKSVESTLTHRFGLIGRRRRRFALGISISGLILTGSILALPHSRVRSWLNRQVGAISIAKTAPDAERTNPEGTGVNSSRSSAPLSFLPQPLSAPTGLGVPTAASNAITLNWAAPAGSVDHYLIERSQNLAGPFTVIATSPSASFNDETVTAVNAYLYRVRAVDIFGAPSPPSNMALGTAITFLNPTLTAQVSEIKAQHITDLRDAIDAVRALVPLSAGDWEQDNLNQATIYANDVQELRDELGLALNALSISVAAYEDSTLYTGANGTLIKKIHIEQLRERATRGSSTSSGPPDGGIDSASARLDPMNRTGGAGEDPLSRNFNWSVPLVSLPGRSGLDLGLSLSYNSLVWTRIGNAISFNDDKGFPAPGFRLGFPVIQALHFNSQANKYSYLLITPSGARVELRQVGTSNLYQAVDSSYLLLDANTMTLRTTDGTQLSYMWQGSDYKCTQVKDRNGNYLTVHYENGRLEWVDDTLARRIDFIYQGADLASITQTWTVNGQAVAHNWAEFTYVNKTIQTDFTDLTVYGAANGSAIRALTKVTLADQSHYDFDYTTWGQVWKVSAYATAGTTNLLNYHWYNLPLNQSTAQADCPRFTERRDWAANWNRNGSGVEQEAITMFAVPSSATIPDTTLTGTLTQVTLPDQTYQKIYFGSTTTTPAWQNGLPLLTESYDSVNTKQRWSTSVWTQDDPNLAYQLNPRVTETNVYDPAQNQARTRVSYATFTIEGGAVCRYPSDVYEYGGTTVMRRTHIEYKMEAPYTNLNRHILGLPSAKYLCDGAGGEVPCTSGSSLLSKVTFQYDETGSIQGADAPVQHDNTNYAAGFVTGRANLSSVKRYDVINTAQFTTNSVQYNTAGAVVKSIDAALHETQISYADAFAANGTTLDTGLPAPALAYPTIITDPDGFTSKIRYNYDFGAPTWKQTPLPNVTNNQPGPQQKIEHDSIGRVQKVSNLVNNAYTKYIYGPNYVETFSTVNNVADEAHSLQVFDGHGRVIGKANNHPGSVGGFSGQLIVYDVKGRAIKQSNPTETAVTISGSPIQPYNWAAAGDDAAAGWIYTQQTYDWKGRPRVTTNPSITSNPNETTQKEASYAGCGCAGGEVVTLTDEGTIDAGVAKRRQQKVYSDVLGRAWKTEVLNWESGSVYSTIVNVYNARDQVKLVNQYAGGAPTDASSTNEAASCPEGSCQKTTMAFDGYGRLQSKLVPEQNAGTATLYTYNSDDTIQEVTDARGASTNYIYNNDRHLVNEIHYSAPGGITPTSNVTFGYDAVGNRISMTDGSGSATYSFDLLSRLQSETKTLNGFSNPFSLSYSYNLAGELTSITDPTNSTINYNFDSTGRLNSVTGSAFGGVTQYATNAQYRAWGALKGLSYGNGRGLTVQHNSRLQTARFDVPNVMTKEYQYYDDGRLRYSQDFRNDKFDRSYTYDHAARISQALSGIEARGGQSVNGMDRPYNETFGYDPLSHVTARTTHYWNELTSLSQQYVNNRNTQPGWSYDADGRVLVSSDLVYNYDGAANVVSFGDNSSVSTVQKSDGDGRRTRSEQFEFNEQTWTWDSKKITYYLRSSVLGGAVATELNADGTKRRTFVHAGGGIVAQQWKYSGGGEWVEWEHRDPANISYRATEASGGVVGVVAGSDESYPQEFDPVGADAGLGPPLVWNPPLEEPVGSLLPYPRMMDPSNPGVGYSMDGIPMPANDFFQMAHLVMQGRFGMLNSAAKASAPRFAGYSVSTYNGRLNRYFGSDRAAAEIEAIEQDHFTVTRNWLVSDGWDFDVSSLQQDQVSTGFALGWHAKFSHQELLILKQVYDRINQKDCVDFVNRILAEHKVKPHVNEFWKLTNKVILNRWKSNLTAHDLGISEDRMRNIRSKLNDRGLAVTLGDDTRVYLTGKMFAREADDSTLSIVLRLSSGVNRDTAGRLVHELFHVAGIHHDGREGYDFDAEIHKNCGLPNTTY